MAYIDIKQDLNLALHCTIKYEKNILGGKMQNLKEDFLTSSSIHGLSQMTKYLKNHKINIICLIFFCKDKKYNPIFNLVCSDNCWICPHLCDNLSLLWCKTYIAYSHFQHLIQGLGRYPHLYLSCPDSNWVSCVPCSHPVCHNRHSRGSVTAACARGMQLYQEQPGHRWCLWKSSG